MSDEKQQAPSPFGPLHSAFTNLPVTPSTPFVLLSPFSSSCPFFSLCSPCFLGQHEAFCYQDLDSALLVTNCMIMTIQPSGSHTQSSSDSSEDSLGGAGQMFMSSRASNSNILRWSTDIGILNNSLRDSKVQSGLRTTDLNSLSKP